MRNSEYLVQKFNKSPLLRKKDPFNACCWNGLGSGWALVWEANAGLRCVWRSMSIIGPAMNARSNSVEPDFSLAEANRARIRPALPDFNGH